MRILQVVQNCQRRGAEVFAQDLSTELRRRGREVSTVYLYGFDGDDSLSMEPSDVCLGGNEENPLEENLGLQPDVLRGLLREIRKFRPDIVQVNGSNTVKYGAAAKALSRRASWPLVYRNIGFPSAWNGDLFKRFTYRWIIMPRVDGVAGVSRASLQDAIQLYKLRVPAVVIGNAVNPQRMRHAESREEVRSRLGVGEDDIVLLFLGALTEVKRPDRFLRIMADASKENVRVRAWIVGDGPLRGSCESLARELEIDTRCQFFGSRENVADFLVGADILLLTSDTEGIPAVVIEAGYLGLPVVARDVGALRECVLHEESGILVNGQLDQGLVTAVLHLANNPGLRSRFGERGRKLVLDQFALDVVGERFDAFYSDLIR